MLEIECMLMKLNDSLLKLAEKTYISLLFCDASKNQLARYMEFEALHGEVSIYINFCLRKRVIIIYCLPGRLCSFGSSGPLHHSWSSARISAFECALGLYTARTWSKHGTNLTSLSVKAIVVIFEAAQFNTEPFRL